MAGAAVKITTELKSPTEVGIYHRLVAMTGPNKGKVYYLQGKRIIIGRGDNADIQIIDTKVSREHAEITFAGDSYHITDLGAHNGIVINNEKVTQKKLLEGEKIVIGQTVFKYTIIKITDSDTMLAVVKDGKKVFRPKLVTTATTSEQPIEIGDLDEEEEKAVVENKKNPKMLVMVAVLAIVAFALFDDGDTPQKGSKQTGPTEEINFDANPDAKNNKKLTQDELDNKRKFASIVQEGQREAREGNYFRAIEDFNHALQLIPNNGQASYYLSKAKQQLDEEIVKHSEKGNREFDSKKYQGAIAAFCSIQQLLQNFPHDERFLNAVAKISAIEVELGKEKGEIKCFEEKPAD